MAEVPAVKCAIYTRKSADEGLDMAYNSLAAQRDACAAYILSQRHEGWQRVKQAYDDGGFSGGNMERPGLQRLLADMARGDVDIIVVYKIDRLTRSLRDFAKIADLLEKAGTSFVAVTQQFNTATSMGRLTLNVLLTFAQFERELCGDRIRDKRAASAKLGIWMGGMPPLGYDAPAKKLVVNPQEAEDVRYIFRRFLELQSVGELGRDLASKGIVSKRRTLRNGTPYGGVKFTWHPLNKILTNPVYAGITRMNEGRYPGRHEAIVESKTFARVQDLVAEIATRERTRKILMSPSLLKGIIFDMAGERLYTTHTRRKGTLHRYYVSAFLVKRKVRTEAKNRIRITATALETYVLRVLGEHLRDRQWIAGILPYARGIAPASERARMLAADLEQQRTRNTGLIRELVDRIEMDKVTLRILLNRRWLVERLVVRRPRGAPPIADSPIEIRITGHRLKCGMHLKVVLENPGDGPEPDHRMVREILRAIRWFEALSSGKFKSIKELAKVEECCPALISNRLNLAFLAPDIIEMIMEGRQPKAMTIASLKRVCPLPLSWEEQRNVLLHASPARNHAN